MTILILTCDLCGADAGDDPYHATMNGNGHVHICKKCFDPHQHDVGVLKQQRDELLKALLDERDALTAEVERLKSMTAVTMGIGRGDGNLFVHGDYDSIKVAQSLVFSAERMRKALKDIRSLSSINSAMNPSPLALTVLLGDIHQIADAVLSKEKRND